ncbi:TPA: chromosome partitioning protein ParA [Yersinia enterocolitica]|uniref:hypothetical protein n=1 Tax=Yersinia enterocolitica TaxID=630 RepID=UPI000327EBAA|nr:hypothetical protein [Yersinia enterocolitica]EKN3324403.1 chromosome partitioning protein ParA [Yersinia enterocolitica]EKN3349101.1 chromosome partitioning protein ParA [Yersinia enterocolitica]EKN3357291.1 chromosome partitioning protein ParA [Yersinia enterocolitica]EKN3363722.1 chromosome partitioning protein ParA [Yersinia enterocolitica]EKN3380284.1 chromosome partitioning protein ParA [Yersinia enterocolitica]
MNGHNKVQDMLSDLQGRYTKLLSDFEKLKEYQHQINLLEEKAHQDHAARETLLRLDAAFPNGFKHEKIKLMGGISQMKMQFKQLETQIKNI